MKRRVLPNLPYRVLVVDDNRAIHEDFRKILPAATPGPSPLEITEAAIFGRSVPEPASEPHFEIDSAYQGEEGLVCVQRARAAARPYALAFVDVRMPPGWDGIETIDRLWVEDPALQVVICTAYSDYSWDETIQRLGRTDRLLILKKPFDPVEVQQLASALTEKWNLARQVESHVNNLEALVQQRTRGGGKHLGPPGPCGASQRD